MHIQKTIVKRFIIVNINPASFSGGVIGKEPSNT